MFKACVLTLAICLLFASHVRGAQGEEIALDKLPRDATEALKRVFGEAEVLKARKEVEFGKELYIITIQHQGRKRDLYVSPDGRVVAHKQVVFSLAELPYRMSGYLLLGLLPGAITGSILRWLVQSARGRELSVLTGWVVAWFGAVIGIGIVLSLVASTPREKDLVVLGLICVVSSGIAASVVVIVALIVRELRGHLNGNLRCILVCSILALVFAFLTIPTDMLRRERANQYFMTQATRQPADG